MSRAYLLGALIAWAMCGYLYGVVALLLVGWAIVLACVAGAEWAWHKLNSSEKRTLADASPED